MGYRGTFITDDVGFEFSESFVEKYKDRYNFHLGSHLPISSKTEFKRHWDKLEDDIVKELKEKDYDYRILGIWFYEDGLLERIVFTKNGIEDYEDSEWYAGM
jgi:hypothetical protein